MLIDVRNYLLYLDMMHFLDKCSKSEYYVCLVDTLIIDHFFTDSFLSAFKFKKLFISGFTFISIFVLQFHKFDLVKEHWKY